MKKIVELLILLILLIVLICLGRIRLAAFYYNQGLTYYERGLYDKATVYFEKSLKIYPSAAISHYVLADTYRERSLIDKAIEEYKKAIKIDPSYIAAYRALSHIYSSRQIYQEALLLIKQAKNIAKHKHDFDKLIKEISFEYMADSLYKGVDSFLAGDKQNAYVLLNRALRIEPNFAYAHYTLGYFYLSDNKYNEAEARLNEAIKIDFQFWPAHQLLGDIYFGKGNYEKAVEKYKTVSALRPKDAVILNNLGLALMRMERYAEALEYLRRAANLEPNNINICYSLASVYRDNRMLNEAIAGYKKVIDSQPGYPNIHNDLADIYLRQGRRKEAKEEYFKEIDYAKLRLLNIQNEVTWLNQLAYAYNGIEEYNKAEQIIKDVIAVRPDYQNAYITLAAIYKNTGKYNEALAALDKAVSLSKYKYKNFIDEEMSRVKELQDPFVYKRASFDKIYLKNGRQLEGIIKEETNQKIVLEVYIGGSPGMIVLYRDNIGSVVRSSQK